MGSQNAVHVLFTDVPSTLSALRTAAQLGDGLDSRIRLLLAETVPYPLPIDEPPHDVRFLCRQCRTLVEGAPGQTVAEIVLCRDAPEGLCRRLEPNSVVVIGKRGGWWPRREDRWAQKLREAGHHVVRAAVLEGLDYV